MSANKSTKRRERVIGKDNDQLYQRVDAAGKTVYEVYYRDENGKQHFDRIDGGIMAARAYRDTKRGNKAQGISVAPNPKIRFTDAANEWMETEIIHLRPGTQDSYRYALKHCSDFGYLDSVRTKDVAKLIQKMREEGYSESQLKRVREVISRVYKFVMREKEYRGINPAENISNVVKPKPSKRKKSRRMFTMAELQQTLAATKDKRFRTLFLTAAITGARLSELLALQWKDIDLSDDSKISIEYQVDRKGIRQPLKTDGSKRTIPIPVSLTAALTAYKLSRREIGSEAFVFSTLTGRPIGQRNVLRGLREAQASAVDAQDQPVFPDLKAAPTFHSFRHLAASIAINAGDPLSEISWRLGHMDTATTASIYSHEIADFEQRQQRQRERDEQRYGVILMSTDGNGSRESQLAQDSENPTETTPTQGVSSAGQ